MTSVTREASVGERSESAADNGLLKVFIAVQKYMLVVLIVLELVVFGIMSPTFFTGSNWINIIVNSADLGLISAGLTLIILMAGIDVSTGFAVGLISWVIATAMGKGLPSFLVLAIAILLGMVLSIFNGLLTIQLSIPSIVATLGTSALFQTILYYLWDSRDVMAQPVYAWLSGIAMIGPIPAIAIIVLMIYILLHLILTKTVFGRNIFAIGSNPEAARLAGINIKCVRFAAYAILGVLLGLAACVYSARLGVVQATSGNELTMLAIASVVVGGTSILGGEGSMLRTLGGLIFISVLRNGVVLIGVPSLWTGVLVGLAILLAITINGLVNHYMHKQR